MQHAVPGRHAAGCGSCAGAGGRARASGNGPGGWEGVRACGPRGGTVVLPSPDAPLDPDRVGGRLYGPAARARMARGWKRSRKAAARRAACSALSGRASACVQELNRGSGKR